MQTRIRIVKRGAITAPTHDSTPAFKNEREREREAVNTVKGWIADWHERKASLRMAANTLVSSISARSERPTKRLSPELT